MAVDAVDMAAAVVAVAAGSAINFGARATAWALFLSRNHRINEWLSGDLAFFVQGFEILLLCL